MEDKVNNMEFATKHRMNLVAIKKVDPYAKDIICSSAHVAFYTFNSLKNEWEKTDVEGAFFIYKRNADPFYSIFINNRLNTTSFVEPITCQLETQSQPPFLLYRNERSRIRGFWFYNSEECGRISSFITSLLEVLSQTPSFKGVKSDSPNILTMLSKAQREYTESKSKEIASFNVLNFFAAVKPACVGNGYENAIPNSLSVDQLEKLQIKGPEHFPKIETDVKTANITDRSSRITFISELENSSINEVLKSVNLNLFSSNSDKLDSVSSQRDCKASAQNPFQDLTTKVPKDQTATNSIREHFVQPSTLEHFQQMETQNKGFLQNAPNSLDFSQFVNAFNYLLKHDDGFVKKLHEAYKCSAPDDVT